LTRKCLDNAGCELHGVLVTWMVWLENELSRSLPIAWRLGSPAAPSDLELFQLYIRIVPMVPTVHWKLVEGGDGSVAFEPFAWYRTTDARPFSCLASAYASSPRSRRDSAL